MSEHYLIQYLEQEYQRTIHHRDTIKRRVQQDINELEREIALLRRLIQQMKHDRLHEATPTKPLTPMQSMKRAEKNRERQQKIKDIQASANKRIADIRSKIGQ